MLRHIAIVPASAKYLYLLYAAALEECSRQLFPEYSTVSKPALRKRGSGASVVRWEAFVQLAARVKTVAITEGA
eukprot:gene10176-8081_t